MPATVQIIEKNGAGGVPTDKTSGTIRFKNADSPAVDLANPMVRPPSGTDWSFEKWLRLNVSGGDYTQITNVVAYTDGANGLGTGIGVFAKAEATFVQPAEATSANGYADLFSYTSGSPLELGAGPFTGNGQKGAHLVMIMSVGPTAAGGVTPSETLTIAWDEI